jgi:capsular polysaccharide biosynthesis protein
MQDTFIVKLINQGRVINISVQATSQQEAKRVAENMYHGYRAMSAQRG